MPHDENTRVHKNLYANGHSSAIQNSQRGADNADIRPQMNAVYAHSELLFGHEKERTTNTLYNVNEPWEQYGE